MTSETNAPGAPEPGDPGERSRRIADRLATSGVVAVLRSRDAARYQSAVETLVDEGIRAIEITLTAPEALTALADIASWLPADVVLGAGTVLTETELARAVDAGAQFVVSPLLAPSVLRAGFARGIPTIPGALTPTELQQAGRLGAGLVKLFPASAVGPRYLADVRGPLPGLAIMPTGGIGLRDVADWIRAGAHAVGLGGPLLGDALDGGDLRNLRIRAGTALDQVASARAT